MRSTADASRHRLAGAHAARVGASARVLLCARDPLADDLHRTLFWSAAVERHVASDVAAALVSAVAVRPDLIVLDRDLPEAERLVSYVRHTPGFARTLIAVLARGCHPAAEINLLGAGADAIVRLPVTPDWAERLLRLLLPSRARDRAS